MNYIGSKCRIARFIIPIMLSTRTRHQYWVEPFVGGGNIIDKVDGDRIGSDVNPTTISALRLIRDHLPRIPKNRSEFTEDDYKQLRHGRCKHESFSGYAHSYGGKWLGGWRRDAIGRRDYVAEAYRNACIQSPKLQGVKLLCKHYADLSIPDRSLIYCDPPYAGTYRYRGVGPFDHKSFWHWCRQKASEGHTIFISEYSAPSDFVCVWSKTIPSSLKRDTGSCFGTERLFQHRSACRLSARTRWKGRGI